MSNKKKKQRKKKVGLSVTGKVYYLDTKRPLSKCANIEQEYPGLTKYIYNERINSKKKPQLLATQDFPKGYEYIKKQYPYCHSFRTIYKRNKTKPSKVVRNIELNNYSHFGPNSTGMRAHRLVYILFANNGNALPRDTVVAHLCGNSKCVNVNHLIATTRRDNAAHTKLHGTYSSTYNPKDADKLTSKDAIDIRDLYASGFWTYNELALKYAVNERTIGRIITGDIWKEAGGIIKEVRYRTPSLKYRDPNKILQVQKIRKLYDAGASVITLAAIFKMHPTTIAKIANKLTYKDVT